MLKYPEDRRTIAFVLFQLLLVALGFLYWRQEPAWLLALHVAATCLFAFITATIVHNTVHVPMFKKRQHNRMAQYFLSVAYGHPVSAYVRGHNLSHHRFTQSNRDVMRTTKARFRWNLLNQLFFFFIVARDLERANRHYAAKMKAEGAAWYTQFRNEKIYALSFVIACFLVDWRAALLFLMVPRLWANWGIVGINYVQHDGCDEDHPVNHSRSIVGRWVNWWTFNNGYHGVHHLRPHLHWTLLPQAHAELVSPTVHPELEQESLLAYCWRAYIWPGKRVTFDGKPVVLPPRSPDEDWMPSTKDLPAGVSLGAVTPDPA